MITDTASLAGRHLLLMARRPASIMGAVIFPLIFATLFFTVFGRVMERSGVDYAQYLLPAIVIQAMFFAAMSASIWAAEDAAGGMVTRLRSMPISRVAPVLALLAGELVRALISVLVLIVVGHVLGFRFERGWLGVPAFVLIALGFATAACLIYLVLGFALGRVEPVRVVSTLTFYPFLMISNLFVPTSAFPDWLGRIVEQQPVSRTADALRAVSTAGTDDVAGILALAALWLAGLSAVAIALAPRAFGGSR